MPNQLAQTKRRKSLTEHAAVLEAIAEIARENGETSVTIMRKAFRDFVRQQATDPALRTRLEAVVKQCAPKPDKRLETPAQLARFKRAQREFDQLLLDLQLETPQSVEDRNSFIPTNCQLKVVEFGA